MRENLSTSFSPTAVLLRDLKPGTILYSKATYAFSCGDKLEVIKIDPVPSSIPVLAKILCCADKHNHDNYWFRLDELWTETQMIFHKLQGCKCNT